MEIAFRIYDRKKSLSRTVDLDEDEILTAIKTFLLIRGDIEERCISDIYIDKIEI